MRDEITHLHINTDRSKIKHATRLDQKCGKDHNEDDDESIVPEVIIFHEMEGDDPDLELHSKLFKLLPRLKPDQTFIDDMRKYILILSPTL